MASRLQKIEDLVLQLHEARQVVAVLEAELKAAVGPSRRVKKRDDQADEVADDEVNGDDAAENVPQPKLQAMNPTKAVLARVGTLRPNEKFPFGEMAKAIYGNDSREARNRISAKLNYLKRQGTITNDGGKWKITSSEDAA